MIKNYFKIAWRNIQKNKGYSAINILGLSLGMTCTILISLWIYNEISFDKFHKNGENIYQVFAHRTFNNQTFTDPSMVLPLADALEKNISSVKNAVVTTYPQDLVIKSKENKIKKSGLEVSDHFFEMFSWKVLEGNPKSIFADPNSIVLTASTAKSIFGAADPINQTIEFSDGRNPAKVVAVIEDVPQSSTLQFDYIMGFNLSDPQVKENMAEWGNSSWQVYVQPIENSNISQIEKQINQIKYQHDPKDKDISLYIAFPFTKLHLHGEFKDGKNIGGGIEYVQLFGLIALFILLIACVNFMNLSTARSEKRSKEVGLRKAVGSNRSQLVFQFFSESILLVFIAYILSIVPVLALLAPFNRLVDKELSLELGNPYFWIASCIIILITGGVAGSYPSLYLSSFHPIRVLKGTFRMGKNATMPRKVLVVGQFVVSIALISATMIVYCQINHIKNRDKGYNQNQLVMLPLSNEIRQNYSALKDELLKSGAVESANRSFSPITDIWWKSDVPNWPGRSEEADFLVNMMSVDVDFTKTFGVKMIEGKDFSGMPSDSSAVIINQATVKILGLKNPIGTVFTQGSRSNTVIGVMDNLVMDSPFKAVGPLFVYFGTNRLNFVNLRLSQTDTRNSLSKVEDIFKKFNPEYLFEYKFVDEEYAKKYGNEKRTGDLALIFSMLAIAISCLGLFGLASFVAEQRTKELGVRKVLGASVSNLWALLSKDFVVLVLIACFVAAPLSYYYLNDWLQKFDYHIEISLWVFVAAAVGALAITILTVSYQAIKAALMNPVKSLKME